MPKTEARASLEVRADQVERAEKALPQSDAAEVALRDAIRCPQCRSLRVQYPQFARHSLLTNLVLGLAAFVGLVEKDYYCVNCHFTWPKNGQRPHRNRSYEAPNYFLSGMEQITFTPNTAAQNRGQTQGNLKCSDHSFRPT